MWQPEASGELGGGPVELKLKPPRKGCFLAVLVALNSEEGPEGMLVGAGVSEAHCEAGSVNEKK